jgi:hypothetical protein
VPRGSRGRSPRGGAVDAERRARPPGPSAEPECSRPDAAACAGCVATPRRRARRERRAGRARHPCPPVGTRRHSRSHERWAEGQTKPTRGRWRRAYGRRAPRFPWNARPHSGCRHPRARPPNAAPGSRSGRGAGRGSRVWSPMSRPRPGWNVRALPAREGRSRRSAPCLCDNPRREGERAPRFPGPGVGERGGPPLAAGCPPAPVGPGSATAPAAADLQRRFHVERLPPEGGANHPHKSPRRPTAAPAAAQLIHRSMFHVERARRRWSGTRAGDDSSAQHGHGRRKRTGTAARPPTSAAALFHVERPTSWVQAQAGDAQEPRTARDRPGRGQLCRVAPAAAPCSTWNRVPQQRAAGARPFTRRRRYLVRTGSSRLRRRVIHAPCVPRGTPSIGPEAATSAYLPPLHQGQSPDAQRQGCSLGRSRTVAAARERPRFGTSAEATAPPRRTTPRAPRLRWGTPSARPALPVAGWVFHVERAGSAGESGVRSASAPSPARAAAKAPRPPTSRHPPSPPCVRPITPGRGLRSTWNTPRHTPARRGDVGPARYRRRITCAPVPNRPTAHHPIPRPGECCAA